jgi:hypothetical protein
MHKFTDISREPTASMFRVEELSQATNQQEERGKRAALVYFIG